MKNFEKILTNTEWTPMVINDVSDIKKGDMPGDKIEIGDSHISKAEKVFPYLLKLLMPLLNEQKNQKVVISVHGGSGVGKSEIGSLFAHYLNNLTIGTYIVSGDNYPRRIPMYNDIERMRIFRVSALKGLVSSGHYTKEKRELLRKLQVNDNDANPELMNDYPWLSFYQESGHKALKEYLGSENEIDFDEINTIITQFKDGSDEILLKRMGREIDQLWYDELDFSHTNVMVIEWTHGNNKNLNGVDIPVLLNSTPQETLEHRKLRNRDGGTDSPFTTMVLGIEQELLMSQSPTAKLIVTKSGELVSCDDLLTQR